MRSRIDGRLAAGGLLLLLACPEAAPPLVMVPPAPLTNLAQIDAGLQPAESPPPVAAKEKPVGALVLSLEGAVEVRRSGSEGWVGLKLGDAIEVGDQVRTAQDGRLELSFDVAQIKVREDSQIEFTLFEPSEVHAKVSGGVEAESKNGAVSLTAGDAEAKTTGGRVSLSYDGRTAVATSLKGRASLTARGETVELPEGQFSTAKGAGPSRPPVKIPKGIALEVSWPKETVTNVAEVTLKGRASPLARVLVAGRKVEIAADGTFSGTVTLKRGRQSVAVVVLDAFGRHATRTRQFTLDPDAPRIKGRVEPYR